MATTALVLTEIQSKAHCSLLDATGTKKKQEQKRICTLKQDPRHPNGEQNGGRRVLAFGAAIVTVPICSFESFPLHPSLYLTMCQIKSQALWAVPLTEQRGATQIKSRLMETLSEEIFLFYISFFVSFLSVSLFSQLNDVRTLNDGWEDRQGKAGLGQWVRRVRLFQSAVGGSGCSELARVCSLTGH